MEDSLNTCSLTTPQPQACSFLNTLSSAINYFSNPLPTNLLPKVAKKEKGVVQSEEVKRGSGKSRGIEIEGKTGKLGVHKFIADRVLRTENDIQSDDLF